MPSAKYVGREREVLALLRAVKAKELTWEDALKAFNLGRTVELHVSLNGLRNKADELARLDKSGLPLTPPPPVSPAPKPEKPKPAPVDPVVAEQERAKKLRDLREEREALEAVAGEKSFRTTLQKVVETTAQRFPPVNPKKAVLLKRGSDTTEEALVFSLSDWHAGEIVDGERTRGFNAYDSATMGRRVYALTERLLSIKARMERGGGWRFRRLVLGLNGDFCSGTVHEVERHSDAPSVVHAVYGTGLLLAQLIRDVAPEFEVVDLYGSSGNHGRLPDARRVQQKDPLRSWDTMIYLYAREHLRQTKHLRWHIPNSYSVAFDVEGWRFLQTHGHDVKSWNSIPHYGINRMVANLNALEASRGTPIHYFLFGHFHTKTSLEHASGEWFINGSLIGGTEFSVQGMGKSDKPVQWLLGVHKDHGVTHRWPLLAEAPANAPSYDVQPWKDLAA